MKAIVLHSIPYNDTSRVVRLFTKLYGVKAYLIRGFSSKNKKIKGVFQPMSLLEVEQDDRKRGSLSTLKDYRRGILLHSFPIDPAKMAIAMYAAEVIERCVPEDQPENELFEYFWNTIQAIDLDDKVGPYPLLITGRLIRFLGVLPPAFKTANATDYLDLLSGKWVNSPYGLKYAIEHRVAERFLNACHGSKTDLLELELTRTEQQDLLKTMTDYLRLHVSSQKELKTLPVLQEVFA